MNQFKNGTDTFNVLDRQGRYALLERTGNYPEFIIAVDIQGETNGYWGQGRYFGNNLDSAKEVYNDHVSENNTAYIDWCDKRK